MSDPGKGKGKARASKWPTVHPTSGPFPRGFGELTHVTESDVRDLRAAQDARRVSSMAPPIPSPPSSAAAASSSAAAPDPLHPTIGVAPRPGQGYDLSRFARRRGASYAPLLPGVREPDQPARGEDRTAYNRDSAAFEAALPDARRAAVASPEARRAALQGMHGLIITGDGNRNRHQTGATAELAAMREPVSAGDREERDSRDLFETEMIREARNRGMPTLGFCGGSWRLLAAYGGQPETIADEAAASLHSGRLSDDAHELALSPDSFVGRAAQDPGGRVRGANSTHWAAPAVRPDGELAQRPGTAPSAENPAAPDVAAEMRVTGVEPQTRAVEAFESRHGAPVIGVQSHPEYYLASRARSPNTRDFADFGDRLFQHFEQATRAYAGRQAVNQELLARVRPIAPTHEGVGTRAPAAPAAPAAASSSGGHGADEHKE